MLQHPVRMYAIDARVGQVKFMDVGLPDNDPRARSQRTSRGTYCVLVMIEPEDRARGSSGFREVREIGARPTTEIDDRLTGSDLESLKSHRLVGAADARTRYALQIVDRCSA